MNEEYILQINDLKTYFMLDEGTLKAVNGVNLHLNRKEVLGIIGESGCGKSVMAQSILQIVEYPGEIVSGEIYYKYSNGEIIDLAKQKPKGKYMREFRGKEISMIFQEPMASFSPAYTIGDQIVETITVHHPEIKAEKAREIAVDMLAEVGMPNPAQRIDDYPHQLSGGMCQRAMIAMALVNKPLILIADEPTTALDVTVQAQITELMKNLQDQFNMSIIYITHDMGVIAEMADNIAVMYLGRIVEYASCQEIFLNPLHPYTVSLLKSIPKIGRKSRQRLSTIPGNVPIPLNLPEECGFYSRCSQAKEGLCNKNIPPSVEVATGHWVSCFIY
jgi:oligopeptide/dipeptide ABC transporter ATP-binding protein